MAQPALAIVSYGYDYAGIRASQKVNGTETRYLVDKNRDFAQVLDEYAPGGSVNASYVYGGDLISQSRNGAKSLYLYDGLGSVRALTNSTGAVTDTYTYDAYGNLANSTGSTANDYRYAGEQLDKNLNQYYLRDRYYGADTGRFTQRDRFDGDLMSPLSLNRYAYVHGNPVNAVDPSGRFTLFELQTAQVEQDSLQAAQTAQTIQVLGFIGGPSTTISIGARITAVLGIALFGGSILHSDEPEDVGLPYIVWGLEYGATLAHTYRALHGSGYTRIPGAISPPVLTYKGPNNQWNRYWIGTNNPNTPFPCSRGITGDSLTCDEYPYASAQEGGEANYIANGNVSIALVPGQEQFPHQANGLNALYQGALRYRAGAVFGVWADNKNWDSYYVYFENGTRIVVPLNQVPIYRNSTIPFTYTSFDSLLAYYNQ
jgi:RHS repeat-associated protein